MKSDEFLLLLRDEILKKHYEIKRYTKFDDRSKKLLQICIYCTNDNNYSYTRHTIPYSSLSLDTIDKIMEIINYKIGMC